MAKNLGLEDDIKLIYEVQIYEYMYSKVYEQHLFSLCWKMSFIQTKLFFI